MSQLLKATQATFIIPNQKNGVKNQPIHNDCTGTPDSPVKSAARHIAHIMENGGDLETPIYTYYRAGKEHAVTNTHINNAVKSAAKAIGLFSNNVGYAAEDVSSHSLRAGGAMAMHLNGAKAIDIMKQGRWKSCTFQQYIHEQISAFTAGLSVKMSRHVEFCAVNCTSFLPKACSK